MEIVMNYVMPALIVIILMVDYYFTIKNNLERKSVELIDEAEQAGLTGEEKMQIVVDKLYKLVPVIFKKFLDKKFIEKIVQSVFDKIEAYAKKQVAKK